ncbi:MAG: hypothetical protein ACXAEN_26825, partial [Candidatus Thorarchaeota archaeon]|jgi:hypothetical protein
VDARTVQYTDGSVVEQPEKVIEAVSEEVAESIPEVALKVTVDTTEAEKQLEELEAKVEEIVVEPTGPPLNTGLLMAQPDTAVVKWECKGCGKVFDEIASYDWKTKDELCELCYNEAEEKAAKAKAIEELEAQLAALKGE